MSDLSDEEMLADLGMESEPEKAGRYTATEERILAGFEDILRFYKEHGRAPRHSADADIFERMYAVRLDQIRALPEATTLLAPLDTAGLLARPREEPMDSADDEALLAAVGGDPSARGEIFQLKHVRSSQERQAAEDVATRSSCADFATFEPLLRAAQRDLNDGTRQTRRFGRDAAISKGDFFVLGGQLAFVAHVGEEFRTPNGEKDARLRVIFSNGTESDLLLRSLQRALYKDKTGRRLTDPEYGPLFGSKAEPDDIETGTIYVLRSKSTHPHICKFQTVIHKIGVTGQPVASRISGAAHSATFLMADVEVVREYKLHNIQRTKLETLFHKLFGAARLNIELTDPQGNVVKPSEWFTVPLPVIDEAVQRIKDGSITGYLYHVESATLVKV